MFFTFVSRFHSLRWFKASLERFSRMKYCFYWSNLYWIKSVWLDTVQNWILCHFLLRFWINRVGCLFLCNTDNQPYSVMPWAHQSKACSRSLWAEPLQCTMKTTSSKFPLDFSFITYLLDLPSFITYLLNIPSYNGWTVLEII